MSTVSKVRPVSVDEYLEGEEITETPHEYVNGVVYAMVGASALHNLITGSIFAQLRSHLRGSRCHVFQSDMKIRVVDAFYYPDVMVVCEAVDPHSYYQTSPVLIVEVLSESTEGKDRLEKRVAYQKLSTLREYVLVSQEKMQIEVIRRDGDGWQLETATYGDTVRFVAIGLEMPIEAFYEDATQYIAG